MAYVAGFVVFEVAYGEFFVEVVVVLFGDLVVPREVFGFLLVCSKEPIELDQNT